MSRYDSWVDKNGQAHYIEDMSTQYIENIIKYLVDKRMPQLNSHGINAYDLDDFLVEAALWESAIEDAQIYLDVFKKELRRRKYNVRHNEM